MGPVSRSVSQLPPITRPGTCTPSPSFFLSLSSPRSLVLLFLSSSSPPPRLLLVSSSSSLGSPGVHEADRHEADRRDPD
eukprot:757767-Hanusia_phi.AAC.5